MRIKTLLLPLLLLSSFTLIAQTKNARSERPGTGAAADYFPPAGEWQHRSPAALGLDSLSLQEAILFARNNEAKAPRDQALA